MRELKLGPQWRHICQVRKHITVKLASCGLCVSDHSPLKALVHALWPRAWQTSEEEGEIWPDTDLA